MSKSQMKRFAVQRRPAIPPNKRHEPKWEEDDPMKDIDEGLKDYFVGDDEEETE